MLSEAVEEIRLKAIEDGRRRQRLLARRQEMRRLDRWLDQVETMLEDDQPTVPEPLVKEISGFLRALDPKLQRTLVRNRAREASQVLDVLFDAQEALLPRLSESVA